VDALKEAREDRFKRLLDEVTGRDNLAYTLAMEIRQREAHSEQRRRELHAAWDEKVYQPIASQAHEHMNPPNRAALQRLSGSKSVSFHIPDQPVRLIASVYEDPARKPLVDNARENAFHQVAHALIGHSHSAPCLAAPADAGGGVVPPVDLGERQVVVRRPGAAVLHVRAAVRHSPAPPVSLTLRSEH